MEYTVKINVIEKLVLFCKFLHNGSSDPYEILYGGLLLSYEQKNLNFMKICEQMRAHDL